MLAETPIDHAMSTAPSKANSAISNLPESVLATELQLDSRAWFTQLKQQFSYSVPAFQQLASITENEVETTIFGGEPDSKQLVRIFASFCPATHLHFEEKPRLHHAIASSLADGYAVVVIVHAEINAPSLLSLYRQGVAEVVVLPYPAEGFPMLLSHLGVANARHRYHGMLRASADTDPLTRVLNRRAFDIQLKHAQKQSVSDETELAIFYIDLDYFKDINDQFGHAVGDKVLMEACNRLQSLLRSDDFLARLGGDEFAALLVGVDQRKAKNIGRRMVEAMRKIMTFEECDIVLTCSVGFAIASPQSESDTINLLDCADQALYNAKSSGRDQASCFHDTVAGSSFTSVPTVTTSSDWRLAADLRKALDVDDQLSLVYQPQIDIHSGKIRGMEALIRWNHPEHGLISPAEFISRSEHCGLIMPLGEYVRSAACAQLKLWQSNCELPADFKLCLNVSPVEIHQQNYTERLMEDLGNNTEMFELEMTETAIARSSTILSRRMHEIKEAGVHLALDDFGTGNSSLSHVTKLPVDTLKVDKSFVQRALDDQRAAAVVKSVYTLAETLDMRVVAEGIETAVQWAFLRNIGSSDGQGFLFSKGVDGAAATNLLNKKSLKPKQRKQ